MRNSNKRDGNKNNPKSKDANRREGFSKPNKKNPFFGERKRKGDPMPKLDATDIRLNKFLSNAGICSRREADVLIGSGIVEVNGKVITELGYKIKPGDIVKYDGSLIKSEAKRYVLLNKPKDFTANLRAADLSKSVMRLVAKACKESISPVGKIDRKTTGLLLLTNDSDMAKKLLHPKSKIKKLYHVVTDKPVAPKHIQMINEGIDLDDGKAKATHCEYVTEANDKKEVGIEVDENKNNLVQRMFESLGYKVVKLDRVTYAGLTKKETPRGEWRHLTPKEVDYLKML